MRGQPYVFDNLIGGANPEGEPYDVSRNQARDVLNFVPFGTGGMRKRDGSTLLTDLTAHSIYASQNPDVLMVGESTKLGFISPVGVYDDLKTGLTAGLRWEFFSAPVTGGQGPIFAMNGTNTPQQWDGVAAGTSDWTAATGTLPNGQLVIYHANRAWIADGSRLYWSELGDVRNWPVENVTAFDERDGSDITALGKSGGYIIVAKDRKLWTVYDLDTGANRKLSDTVGCPAHRSMVETPSGTMFYSGREVYSTDGSALSLVSTPVSPYLAAISVAAKAHLAAAYFDDHYYLSYSTDGTANGRTLDFHLPSKSWWPHSFGAEGWAVWTPATDYELIGAGADVYRALQENVTTDLGVAYPCLWAQGFETFQSPALKKHLREVFFEGEGYIEFSVARDFEQSRVLEQQLTATGDTDQFGVNDGTLFGVNDGSVYGGAGAVGEARGYTFGVARAWSVIFGNATDDSLQVNSFTMSITGRTD